MTRAMHRVLVVEDEPEIRAIVRLLLEGEGYRVAEAENAERALIAARTEKPDLVLLDLGLPDGDGLQVVRGIRAWSPMPIVVLSARTLEEQKILALDAGADDYVTKPFSAPELLARARAALRRNAQAAEHTAVVSIGSCRLDLQRRTAEGTAGGIHLTPIEFRVLESLVRQSGLIVTQQQIIREVWGPGREDDSRNLRVVIRSLRQKLEPDPPRPRYLITESGVGYRLLANGADSTAPQR
jgi:two-component system, OmpR family, KDP operon response regulator KdpE